VAELRRRMTRSEFHSWIAFARVYPMVEVADGPSNNMHTLGGDAPPDVPGLDASIVQAFAASSPRR